MKTNNVFSSSEFTNPLLCEKYKKFTHSSGLDIYVFPKKLTTFYAIFGVKYGSIHNSFSLSGGSDVISVPEGVAHFLEHKLFSAEDGSDAFERFSEYGADANAYTSFNKTAYLFSCTENFERSLAELIDFVTHPYFTSETVSTEVGIISEEIKMYDDSPQDRCFYGMLEGMYEKHSIRNNICGSVASISKITEKTLYDCYNAFYNLNNMVLIICGDVDFDSVLQIANEHLPATSSPFSASVKNDNDEEARGVYKQVVRQQMQVSRPIFNIGFKDVDIPKDPFERQRKDAGMAILDEMIFSRAGELYRHLFENDIISPNLSYGYTISETSAYNSIAGEADDPLRVLDEIKAYIISLKDTGLSHEDFMRGKRVMYAEFVKSFDSTESIANNLFSFVCEDAELLSYADVIASVTFEYVCELFGQAFDEDCITVSVINPLDIKK